MEHDRPVLGDFFPHCEVLTAASRRQVATLLAVAGRAPAVFPADLVSLPVPGDPDTRVAVRTAIMNGLGPDGLARLATARFGDVVPAVEGRDGGVGAVGTTDRLYALLDRNGATSWAVLRDLTVAEITRWYGVGHSTAVAIVGLALEAGLSSIAGATTDRPPTPDPAPGTIEDLAVLLAHDGDGGLEIRRSIEAMMSDAHPPTLRLAAARLLGGVPRGHPCLASLERALAAAGDERDRGVLVHRVLQLEGRATTTQLSKALDVGEERIRQLRKRAEKRVRVALENGPAHVRALAAEAGERLGAAAPLAAVDEWLGSLRLPRLPDSRSLLLLWLAGPYHPIGGFPGWVAVDPAGLVAETSRLIHDDGGVRPAEQVGKELERFGVTAAHIETWLRAQPVRFVDDLVVVTTGPAADIVERALFATGRAMTVEEISSWVEPGDRDHAGLSSLLRREPRFIRVGPDHFELAEWGGGPHDDRQNAGASTGDPLLLGFDSAETRAEVILAAIPT